MNIRPFRGFRPPREDAARVASVPYDVVNAEEARRLAEGNPDSFLHVIRPEIDLDPAIDPYDAAVYERASANFRSMIERGKLVRDSSPSYYVYRLTFEGASQTGLVGAASVDDYLEGRIKKHEFTRPAKEDDRVRMNDALGATPGPVFLTYRSHPSIDAEIASVTHESEATVDFEAGDGVHHEMWVVDDPGKTESFRVLMDAVPATYVADGHHRAAAAARVAARRSETLTTTTGDEPCRYFLAVHFPSNQLRVLDYNRVVRGLNGLTSQELLERIVHAGFNVGASFAERKPDRRGSFGLYLDGAWHRLEAREEIRSSDPVDGLDVAMLSDRVLEPLLGISDPRTDPRIDFVGGIRGMNELERRVNEGDADVAFALYPTSLEEVMAVADAGRVMPPKSTWFEPKLRSGLVVQTLEGDTL